MRKIVVLPLENQTRYREIPGQFGERLSAALHSTAGFEVVQVDRLLSPPCPLAHIERGEYPIELLVDMYRNYNADAVLFTRVDHYHPYEPLALGVTTILVDTREASVVAWASGHWSLSQSDVYASFRCYNQHRPAAGLDQSVLMRSPEAFRQYVADLIVNRWVP